MSWEELKLEITKAYGPEAAELVSEHDGNAEDPFFTVEMKMIPRSVPVPHHWSRLRAFLSNQADREEASGIIPAEIAALGVDKLRASKDKKANPNQMAFVTCFLTGTPLKRKTFGVPMTEFGEVFYENKWIPHARYTPGEHSQRLRQALGLENGSSAHPRGCTVCRRCADCPRVPRLAYCRHERPYPTRYAVGPRPVGEPPRASNNSFLFPGVMGETTSTVSRPTFWGAVPELRQGGAAPAAPTTAAPPVAPAAKKQAAPVPTPPVAPAVVVNPEPFIPASYRPNTHAAPIAPREYSKVQDTGSGTVAGHKMVPEPPGKSK
ncbi:splicing factor 3B subunit 2 [Angomonas deanei]|uniref:DUF382 domain-containing protein n=1 Tax=Angomonas deanei TaxID=59799 RepID=A0A7G2CFD6_9TRYP|nr:splicing factor 3B subunit 2 [Angomonas deanei]CAD2218249.1 Domain of unknown function (DUF382), putative [Angomonas deanei]|eukprot:EPY28081.1 splicing factor 3B subunit 2 [Angomonas deanei]